MTSSKTEPPVYRFWNLSTRHIPLRDAKLLPDSPCLVVYEHEYGWLVLVPQDDVNETLDDLADRGFSEALRNILRRANEQDVRMVRFDADGDLVAELAQFDW